MLLVHVVVVLRSPHNVYYTEIKKKKKKKKYLTVLSPYSSALGNNGIFFHQDSVPNDPVKAGAIKKHLFLSGSRRIRSTSNPVERSLICAICVK